MSEVKEEMEALEISLTSKAHRRTDEEMSTCGGFHLIGSDVTRTQGKSDTNQNGLSPSEQTTTKPINWVQMEPAVSQENAVPRKRKENGMHSHCEDEGNTMIRSRSTQDKRSRKTSTRNMKIIYRNYSKAAAATSPMLGYPIKGALGKTEAVLNSSCVSKSTIDAHWVRKDFTNVVGIPILFRRNLGDCSARLSSLHQFNKCYGGNPLASNFARSLASSSASQSTGQAKQEQHRKDISTVDDPFDAPTYNIPEKPVTFTQGDSYSLVILVGLGIAAAAGYAIFKELIFQPKEYKIFGKALERVQNDGQVKVRIGSPVTGYGQESRNHAARQQIANRTWTDEDGVERVEVNFYICGPHGAGKVYLEMFKDKVDKQWKFTYLIIEIKSPTLAQLMLESYVPA